MTCQFQVVFLVIIGLLCCWLISDFVIVQMMGSQEIK